MRQGSTFIILHVVIPILVVEKIVIFPLNFLDTLFKNTIEDERTILFLECVFYFFDMHVSLYGSDTLSWLLQHCNKFWNMGLLVLLLCFPFSRLSWIFCIPCISITFHTFPCIPYLLELFVNLYKEASCDHNTDYVKFIDQFDEYYRLKIVSILSCEHEIYFPLSMSFYSNFTNVLCYLM